VRGNPRGRRRAAEIATEVGKDVLLARATLGITRENAAAIAGVSPMTFAAVEEGSDAVRVDTLTSVCDAVGLRLWAKAYPSTPPTLRDTGQLELVTVVTAQAHSAWRPAMELVLDAKSGRAADLVLFGPDEIQHHEYERNLLDWQGQLRAGRVKQELLASMHQRPVRLVMVVEDTYRNRRVLEPHIAVVRRELLAGPREVWRSIRTGEPLGRDGLLWVRRPRRP
jgi:DNA-binding XRE family transcriptional regulator